LGCTRSNNRGWGCTEEGGKKKLQREKKRKEIIKPRENKYIKIDSKKVFYVTSGEMRRELQERAREKKITEM